MIRANGQTYESGTRVRVKGITDSYDADLNGRVGRLLRRPLQFAGWPIARPVGVKLDETPREREISVNIKADEFEVIDDE